MSDSVTFALDAEAVGTVTLNRPDKLNAMDMSVFDGLHRAGADAAAAIEDGRCRAVLIRGEGRAFSAGLDVSMFGAQAAGEIPESAWIAHLQQAFTVFEDLRAPVVAAVNGAALGGGMQLALAAHLRIVADDVQMALLEARWGIIPDLGGLTRLPRLVGISRATDLAITARKVGADEAHAWGLADRVVPAGDLDEAARTFAGELAAGPTLALGAIPSLLRQSIEVMRDESLLAERTHQIAACLPSADFKEAAAAAAQGRPPTFTGR